MCLVLPLWVDLQVVSNFITFIANEFLCQNIFLGQILRGRISQLNLKISIRLNLLILPAGKPTSSVACIVSSLQDCCPSYYSCQQCLEGDNLGIL